MWGKTWFVVQCIPKSWRISLAVVVGVLVWFLLSRAALPPDRVPEPLIQRAQSLTRQAETMLKQAGQQRSAFGQLLRVQWAVAQLEALHVLIPPSRLEAANVSSSQVLEQLKDAESRITQSMNSSVRSSDSGTKNPQRK